MFSKRHNDLYKSLDKVSGDVFRIQSRIYDEAVLRK